MLPCAARVRSIPTGPVSLDASSLPASSPSLTSWPHAAGCLARTCCWKCWKKGPRGTGTWAPHPRRRHGWTRASPSSKRRGVRWRSRGRPSGVQPESSPALPSVVVQQEVEMSCRRRSPAELVAVRERLLKARRGDPDLTAVLLAERFCVPRSTVEKWLHESGLGQLRAEDRRGVRPVGPAVPSTPRTHPAPARRPVVAPLPFVPQPHLVWHQAPLLEVTACPHPRHSRPHPGTWCPPRRTRRPRPEQEAFSFVPGLPVRAKPGASVSGSPG